MDLICLVRSRATNRKKAISHACDVAWGLLFLYQVRLVQVEADLAAEAVAGGEAADSPEQPAKVGGDIIQHHDEDDHGKEAGGETGSGSASEGHDASEL